MLKTSDVRFEQLLLFLFVNDLSISLNHFSSVMFPDEVKHFLEHKKLHKLFDLAIEELLKTNDWFIFNKLYLYLLLINTY